MFQPVTEETNTITLETEKVEAWLNSADPVHRPYVRAFLSNMGYNVKGEVKTYYKVSKR